jgi:DNA-binding CsgD family transcriptional regulator
MPAYLSTRQLQVLYWIGEGKTPSEIAVILGIHVGTVSVHRQRLLDKLQLENTAQLMRYGILGRIASAPSDERGSNDCSSLRS